VILAGNALAINAMFTTPSMTAPRKRHLPGAPTGGCGCGGDEVAGVTGGSYESSSASFGRVYSVFGAIVGTIIAIILVCIGISRLRDPHTFTATATVVAVTSCQANTQNPQNGAPTSYSCVVSAVYTVGGGIHAVKGLAVARSSPLQVGSTFTIRYDPSTPSDAVYELSPRGLGWGLIGFGLLIGGVAVGIAVEAHKSEGFAAGYGTIEGVGLIARSL
jgi:hypothetical protein